MTTLPSRPMVSVTIWPKRRPLSLGSCLRSPYVDQQQVCFVGNRFRIAEHGPIVATEVSAEHERLPSDAHDDRRRPEEMAHRAERHLNSRSHWHRTIEADRLQQLEGSERVSFGKQRIGWPVARVPALIGLARVFFLQPACIGQYKPAEILRAGRAEHAAAESACDQARQIPGVIEMRVRQDHRMNGRWRHLELRPVPLAERLQTLEESAIDENARAFVLEEVLRPGDRSGRTQKRETQHLVTIRWGRRKGRSRPGHEGLRADAFC
jgi:hypothetical protein